MNHKATIENNNNLIAANLFPHSKRAVQVLQERAKFLADTKNIEIKRKENQQYIKIRIDAAEYGILFQHTTRVISRTNFTYIPFAEKYIIGTINHRGELIAIIDVPALLYQKIPNLKKEGTLVIVSLDNVTLGIRVDEIIGSEIFAKQQLGSPSNSKNTFITGIHQGIVAILNIAEIIEHVKLHSKGENS